MVRVLCVAAVWTVDCGLWTVDCGLCDGIV